MSIEKRVISVELLSDCWSGLMLAGKVLKALEVQDILNDKDDFTTLKDSLENNSLHINKAETIIKNLIEAHNNPMSKTQISESALKILMDFLDK